MAYTPSKPYIFRPDGWDTGWKTAKANFASASATLAFIGDSVTQGANSSNCVTTSYPARLRALLSALYPTYGDFYGGQYNATFNSGVGVQPFAIVSNASTAGPNGISDVLNNSAAVAFGTTGDFNYTTPYACTAIDIIGWDVNTTSYTWQYNVDNTSGTGLSTVTTNGFNGTHYRVPLTGLSNQIHTVRFGNASSAGGMQVNGAISYTGNTGGILYAFNGMNGASAKAGNTTSWRGNYKTSSSDTTHLTGFGAPTAPTLAIIGWGINDCQSQSSFDNYWHLMRQQIQNLRRGNTTCSILLLGTYNADPDTTDTTTRFTNSENWPKYLAMQRQLAAAFNCAHVNIHAKWGETPVTQGYMTSGNAHPTDAGYTDMATLIAGIL